MHPDDHLHIPASSMHCAQSLALTCYLLPPGHLSGLRRDVTFLRKPSLSPSEETTWPSSEFPKHLSCYGLPHHVVILPVALSSFSITLQAFESRVCFAQSLILWPQTHHLARHKLSINVGWMDIEREGRRRKRQTETKNMQYSILFVRNNILLA